MLEKFKNVLKERPDLIFFGAFLFVLPFSWRKVITVYNPPGFSGFNEYTDISIYVADILLAIMVLLYLLSNKESLLSISKKYLFHMEHIVILIFPVLLLLMALISSITTEQKVLGLYSWLRMFEMTILYWYILLQFVPRGTNSRFSTWNIIRYILLITIISGLFQSLLAIVQFIQQSSISLQFLGESIVSRDMPAVAKIILLEKLYVRSYGTFLHPNVLGGYLFFAIMSLLYLKKQNLFYVEHFVYVFLLGILAMGTVLTFSKSAILALIVGLLICSTWNIGNVFRGGIYNPIHLSKGLFHVEQYILLIFFSLVLICIILFQNPQYLYQSISERIDLVPISVDIMLKKPFFGLGNGNFVYNMYNYPNITEGWQLQPVHNIYLLMASENGLIYTVLFVIFIFLILKYVPRGTIMGKFLTGLLIGLLIIGFFDHYLWDIHTGQSMFWIALSLSSISILLTKAKSSI